MKKLHKFFAFMLILSITTLSTILFTKDINKAQAAGSIYLNNSNLTLELGHYSTLRVRGTSSRAYWSSGNSRVASVSSSGKVTARGWGSTTITASVAGKKLNSKVTVVQINKKYVTLTPDEVEKLTLWGANTTVYWKSSNKSVATVSSDGKVTAKAPGTAIITATMNDKNIASTVTVADINEKSVVLEYNGRFSINGGSYGYSKKLKINTTQNIRWSSSDEAVATVSSSGKVIAQGAGTATITGSVSGRKFTTQVKVLQISSNSCTLKKGNTILLDIYGTDSKITWDTYNKSVATVSSDGKVTAKAPGTAKIVGYVDGRIIRSIVSVTD